MGEIDSPSRVTPRDRRVPRAADGDGFYRRQLEAVCDNATVALFITDARRRCTYMNPAAEDLTGYTLAEVRGRPLHDYVHHTRPDGRPYPLEECPIDRALPENNRERGEEVFVRKDGTFYPVAFTATPVREGGVPVGAVIEVRDLTEERLRAAERERAAAKIRESEADFRAAFEVSSVGTAQADPLTGRFLRVNEAMCRLTGYDEGELLAKTFLELTHPDDRASDLDRFRQVVRGEAQEYSSEKRYVRKDGRIIWVGVAANLVRDRDGRPLRTSAVIQDVTARKQAEEELRKSENQLRLVTDAVPALIAYVDAGHRYRFVNGAYTDWFGHAPEEIVGRHVREVLGEAAYAELLPAMERVLSGEAFSFERLLPYKDGGPRYVQINYVPDRGGGGEVKGYYALVQDVTERKRAEEQVKLAAERAEVAQEAARASLYEFIPRTGEVIRNATILSVMGYAADEIPATADAWKGLIHPDDLGPAWEAVGRGIESGAGFAVEYRARHKEGRYVWLSDRARVFRGGRGEAERVVGMILDVTERKQAEAEQKFLLEIAETIRREETAEALLFGVVRAVGRHLGVSRSLFMEIDLGGDAATVHRDFHADGLPPLAGRIPLSRFSPESVRIMRGGRTLVNDDIRNNPRTAEFYESGYRDLGMEAFVGVPLMRDGRWVAALAVIMGEPRRWTEREVRLLESVAERAWLAVEKIRIDDALRESEARHEIIARATNDALWDWDLTTKRLSWNDGVRTLFGYAPGEVSDSVDWWYGRIHPEDRGRVVGGLHGVIEGGGQEWSDEYRFVRADGSSAEVIDRGFVIRDGRGRPVRMLGGMTDITERKRAEEALRLSEERYRGIVNQTVGGIAEVDLTGRFLIVNDRYCDITGYAREELLGGLRMQDITHEEDLPGNLEQFQKCLTEGTPFEIEKRYVRKDGAHVWVHNSVSAVRGADGRPRSIAAVSVDISERRRAEQQIAGQNQTLEALAAGTDLAGILALAARTIEELLPGARSSVLLADAEAKRLSRGSAESLPAEYNAAIEGLTIGEGVGSCGTAAHRLRPVVVTDIARDPLWKDFRALAAAHHLAACWSHPILAPGGELLGTFATYFSEPRAPTAGELVTLESAARVAGLAIHRKQTEERLRESEERFRALFDSIDEGFCIVEVILDEGGRPADYRFVEANPAFARLTGLAGAMGRTAREMVPGLEEFWYETYGKVALTGEAVRFENWSEPMSRWFDVFASRVGGPTSRRVAIVFNNITGRKRAEEERERLLEREQRARLAAEGARAQAEAARLEAEEAYRSEQEARREAEEANRLKDEFLATVSHELRTPLTAILGWADMLAGGHFDGKTRAQALDVIRRNARAQNQLVGDLLDVSRIITGKLRIETLPVELGEVVGAALDVVRPAADAKGVKLHADFGRGPFALTGDPERLQQAVWNLLSNAVKFTPGGGRVEVSLRRVGARAVVSVADTGQGIHPDFLPHVFDRFRQQDGSSTRRHGGLGLGLSIVRHLVELHGGEVRAESAGVGQGATFAIGLPLRGAAAAATRGPDEVGPPKEAAAAPASLAGVRVLVVDDDTAALEMLRAAFEQGGAAVETAASAAAALAAFSRSAPDVMVSDIGMPSEDGYSLIHAVRALPPARGGGVPAVALTAYAGPLDRERALASGFQAHVAKPVEPPELLSVVARLAGRGARS